MTATGRTTGRINQYERAAQLHAEGQTATADMRPMLGSRRLREALRLLDQTPAEPDRAATQELRGRILVSLAYAEADQGHIEHGWRLLAEAEQFLLPAQRGALFGQRGLFLSRIGENEAAIEQYDAAIAVLRERAEPQVLARALLNRGNLYLSNARLRLARADLRRCIEVATRQNFSRIVPIAKHSLGYLDFLAGDLPAALGTYSAVAREYAVVKPGLLPVLGLDKARALIVAGLFREADRELASALAQFRSEKLGQDYAEAQLSRAEAALLGGDAAAAKKWATHARALFLRRDNRRWAALAALLALRADHAIRRAPAALARRAHMLAETLTGLGLPEDGRSARLLAARSLVSARRVSDAHREVERCGPPRRSDRLDTRLLWRLTRAELAAAAGHHAEASRHLSTGLADLQNHRSQLGGLDLQTGVAVHGRELARAGLRAALAHGSTADVFRWSERARAQALLLPPVRPPEDPVAAESLEELRQVRAAIREAELAGRPAGGLRWRSEALQRAIREHTWSMTGPGTAVRPAPFASVKAQLGDAAMVIYLRDGPALSALVVVGRSAGLVALGLYEDAQEAVLRLRADLDAAAGRALPRRLAQTVAMATRRDADTLAAVVLDPLLRLIGDRDLVVVPTGILVTVPWAALPACARRPVTVAPSASTWSIGRTRLLAAMSAPSNASLPALLVAGPDNERGEPEVRAIAAMRRNATILIGPAATPAAALAGMDGVAIAHLAAHGHHEPDNPLFSSLDLAGGQIMGYDLQRIGGAPATVVLSSCELGLSAVRPGDETLGMVAALLSAGTSTVVASVSRVADHTAMEVMTSYHEAISHGRPPATALAAAGTDHPAGFICFGAG